MPFDIDKKDVFPGPPFERPGLNPEQAHTVCGKRPQHLIQDPRLITDRQHQGRFVIPGRGTRLPRPAQNSETGVVCPLGPEYPRR